MRILHKNNIIDLFVWVDDSLPKELGSGELTMKKNGRPAYLTISETITILLFSHLTAPQKTLMDVWKWAITNYSEDFKLPCYSKFVEHCHISIPYLAYLLEQTFNTNAPIKLIDSTMLPVCSTCRGKAHKVAKGYTAWGKNHQGWWYGFKLHAMCDLDGNLCGILFTPANEADSAQVIKLINDTTKILVGDGGYNARVMREKIWKEYHCLLLAPPHPKQKKKLTSKAQIALLRVREKIECVFDYLKNHLHLVTSFPRSINGYLLNYLRNLLGYQVRKQMKMV